MAVRNEHLVVVLLESMPLGVEFEDWPLHITLVPWFPCRDESRLDKVLQGVAANNHKLQVTVGKRVMFGPRKDIPVNLLTNDGDLYRLHWDVFRTLETNGFPIHQKTHLGQNYRAHITHQGKRHKNEGDVLPINSFVLVRQIRLKKTGRMIKAVVKEYELQ